MRDQIERSKDEIREIVQLESQKIIGELTPQFDVLKMRYSKLIDYQTCMRHEILSLDHERSQH